MRSRSRRAAASLALSAVLSFLALPALAAETHSADVGLVPRGHVIHDDLYTAALTVIVSGTVEGDLIAAAADRVIIDGVVEGSVTALAPEVIVTGRVGGALRASGGSVTVVGEIAGDVVAATWTLTFGQEATVGGEVLYWGRRLSFAGTVSGDIRGSASRVELAGTVGRNVEVSAGRLAVTGPLRVEGDLGYRSRVEASGLDQADVAGVVVRRTELPPNIRVRAVRVMARMVAAVMIAIVAVTVVWCWPDATARAARRVRSPRSLLVGLLVALAPVFLIGLGWLVLRFAPRSAALPFMLVLAPLVVAVVALLGFAALVSFVPVSAALGSRLFRGLGPWGATLGGAIVLGLILLVPRVGWLVPLVVFPLGLGSWLTMRQATPTDSGSS
jgi:cytoskeletal protein CcmA (bactofilin family)